MRSLGWFSILFTAVLTMTFDRFSINGAMTQDFLRIADRDGKIDDELSKVLPAMLYTDDADIASRS